MAFILCHFVVYIYTYALYVSSYLKYKKTGMLPNTFCHRCFFQCQQNSDLLDGFCLDFLRQATGKSFQLPFSVASLVLGIVVMCYRWRKRRVDTEGQSFPGEAEDEKLESFLASKNYWRCLKIVQIFDIQMIRCNL